MPTQKKQLNPVLLAVMGLLLGVLTFLLIYGKAPLDTGNDNWIFYGYDETDIRQDYAGWLGFRSSSWQFPLAQADSFAQPSTAGVNISFTDSLPLVSVLFKLFRAWQPVTFQWYGWYELFTYAMQGCAAALLLGLFVQSLAGAAAGTLLFTFSPVMMERAFRHPSLSSHYFVVFALYFYLRGRREKRCFTPAFWVLAAAGTGVTPYFLPLVAIFALLLAIDRFWQTKKWQQPALLFVGSCAAGMAMAYLLGSVGNGYSASRDGYGFYSMNLASPLNPKSLGGYTWSRTLHTRLMLYGQYDGFNYLGLGVLALLAVMIVLSAAACIFSAGYRKALLRTVQRNLPLVIAMAFLTLFAASNVLCWDDTELVNIPLPAFLLNLCDIFRASSRMFWGVYYTLILTGIVWLVRVVRRWFKREWLASALLVLVAAVQIGDLWGVISEKHTFMTESAAKPYPVPEELTEKLANYDTLFMTEWFEEGRTVFSAALKYGMTTNGRDANTDNAAWRETERWETEQTQALQEPGTQLNTHTLYVTRDAAIFAKWMELYGDRADFVFWRPSEMGVETNHDELDMIMLPRQ